MAFIEQNGDVKPSYSGINAPRYSRVTQDKVMPHDMYGDVVPPVKKSDAIEGDLHPSYHEDYVPVTGEERVLGQVGIEGARAALEAANPPRLVKQ